MIKDKTKALLISELLEAPKFDLFVEFRSQQLNTTRNSAYVLGAFIPVYGIGNSGNYRFPTRY